MTTKPIEAELDAGNIAHGVLHSHINDGVRAIRDHVIRHGMNAGKGVITIKIVVGVEDDGRAAKVSVGHPKITLPDPTARGQIVRFVGDAPIVDMEEVDDRVRRLPFTTTSKKD